MSSTAKIVGGVALLGALGIGGYFVYRASKKKPCDPASADMCGIGPGDGLCYCCEEAGGGLEDELWRLLHPGETHYTVKKDSSFCETGGNGTHDCSWKSCIYSCCGTDVDPCGGGPNYYSGGHGIWSEAQQQCVCGFANKEANAERCIPVPYDLTMSLDYVDFTGSAKLLQTPGWANCAQYAPAFTMCFLLSGLCPEGPAKYPLGYEGTIKIQLYDQWTNPYKGEPVMVGLYFNSIRTMFGHKIADPQAENGILINCLTVERMTDVNGVVSFPIVQTYDAGAQVNTDVLVTAYVIDGLGNQAFERTGQLSHLSIGCGYAAKDVLQIPDALHTCQFWKYSHTGCGD